MKSFIKKKSTLLVVALVLALAIAGSTWALLTASDSPVQNTFALGHVTTEIVEDLTSGKEVFVKNTGTVSAYVRVRMAVSGVDPADVRVTYGEPSDEDHVWLILDSNSIWSNNEMSYSADGFYYYLNKLAPGATTDSPLLSKVYVGSNLELDETNFSVSVYHESVLATDDLHDAGSIANKFNS